MSENEVIEVLLTKERDINNKIHNAISEIMRLGYETERGKKIIPNTVESIQYLLEELIRTTKN